jgi:hypothetical protein
VVSVADARAHYKVVVSGSGVLDVEGTEEARK